MGERSNHWSDGKWFAVPVAWPDDGTLAKLDRTALLTLLKMLRHAAFDTGLTWVGADQLGRAVSSAVKQTDRRRVAERARNRVCDAGLAELVERGGGRERANVYQMRNPGAATGVSGEQTPTAEAPKHRPTKPNTPAQRASNPGACAGPTQRTQTTKPMHKAPPAVGGKRGAARPGSSDRLGHVEEADLSDIGRLIDLFCRWSGRERPTSIDNDLLNFVAAAVHAATVTPRNGKPIKSPPALFASMVRDGDYSKLTLADEDEARRWLNAHLHGAPAKFRAEPYDWTA